MLSIVILNKEHTQILRFTFDPDSIQDWTDRSTLANVSTFETLAQE